MTLISSDKMVSSAPLASLHFKRCVPKHIAVFVAGVRKAAVGKKGSFRKITEMHKDDGFGTFLGNPMSAQKALVSLKSTVF